MKHYCNRCQRELDEAKIVWLEFDRRNDTYHDFGDIPNEHNQGGFAFGKACADRARKDANRARKVAEFKRKVGAGHETV